MIGKRAIYYMLIGLSMIGAYSRGQENTVFEKIKKYASKTVNSKHSGANSSSLKDMLVKENEMYNDRISQYVFGELKRELKQRGENLAKNDSYLEYAAKVQLYDMVQRIVKTKLEIAERATLMSQEQQVTFTDRGSKQPMVQCKSDWKMPWDVFILARAAILKYEPERYSEWRALNDRAKYERYLFVKSQLTKHNQTQSR